MFVDDSNAGKFHGAYAAAKAAQRALFTAWEAETATSDNLSVVSFEPEPMATATRARFYPGEDREPLADTHAEAARLITSIS